jgi:hypothetical protein
MKRLLWLLCALALPAAAQHAHHGPAHKVAAAAKLAVTDNGAGELAVRLGPLDLPADSDHMQVAQAADQILEIPFDGWITAYHPRLTDAKGATLPGRMLHHVAFWNTERSDFLCPNKEEHIFGAGGEMNDWPAQPGIGYRVRRGERIRVNTMFHNPTGTSYPEAYLEVRMEYRRAGEGQPLASVYPTWFDVMECGNSGYDLTPGENVTTGVHTLKFDGRLLGVGGHLHDLGRGLALTNRTRGGEIARLEPKLNERGHILEMPVVLFTPAGYELRRGDAIEVVARYDNSTGKPLPQGAMGIVVGYFLPANDAEMAALRRAKAAAQEHRH